MSSHKFEIKIIIEGLYKYVGCITHNEEHIFEFPTEKDALKAINNAVGFNIEGLGNRMKENYPWKNMDFIIVKSHNFSN